MSVQKSYVISEADMKEASDKAIAAYEAQKAIWERTKGEMEVSAVVAYAIANAMKSWQTKISGTLYGFAKTNQQNTIWAHPVDGPFMGLLERAHEQNEPVAVKFDNRYLSSVERKMVSGWLDAKYLAPAYVMRPRPEKAEALAEKVIELSDRGVLCSIHRNGEIFLFGGDLDELNIYVDTTRQLGRWVGLSVVEYGNSGLLYSPADFALLNAIAPGTPHVWYTTSLNKPNNTVTCATFESRAEWSAYQVSLLDKPDILPFESGEMYTDETRSITGEPRKRERSIALSPADIAELITSRETWSDDNANHEGQGWVINSGSRKGGAYGK